eukprot:Amastigsp_a849353_34.p2 type:complete len:364 gc:universal Amastigsp_a849353_34:418-1509(+)
MLEHALGLDADAGHHLNRLARVLPRRGLAREHNGVGPVEDGVGDVCCLGACGARVAYHRVKHLGGCDDGLASNIALPDHSLLLVAHVLDGDLDAEVATCHHDSVRDLENFVKVCDALARLDLRDDSDARLADAGDRAHGLDVCCVANERRGDHVDVHPDAELDVGFVFLGHRRQINVLSREIDAFVVAELTRVADLAAHRVARDLTDNERNEAVVHQNDVAGHDGCVESRVCDAYAGCVTDHARVGVEHELVAALEEHSSACDFACANLRAFGVEHDCDLFVEVLCGLTDGGHGLGEPLVGAVGEIEPRHRAPALDEAAQHLGAGVLRPDRADDFRADLGSEWDLSDKISIDILHVHGTGATT